MKRILSRLLVALIVLLMMGMGGFVAWAETAPGPQPAAQAALQSTAEVVVQQEPWLIFTPTDRTPTTGLIFYPGGRVRAEAYAAPAQAIAEQGFLVVIVPMPLNLALFAPERANDVIAAYPNITHWAVGGHSLGGAMAATYAHAHQNAIDGLVLWAAYPQESDSLAGSQLLVAQLYGSNDTVLNAERLAASYNYLPAGTTPLVIAGGNHAQFGDYGPQSGDTPATISAAEQQRQTVDATVALLRRISEK